ncbi:CDP-diacylglycerol--serine O-phosphatidyltransferase [Roseiconus nitratireducens]|uniref:CDP-diacylglycerol--serine O-phosphatidyltransferase n=1 Tax=Roseiconus nitratireducens TaxID=2605748 RepID=A0A5M6DI49_9BACT|nr:CDP-alcohol phosphatidyltransferase family protein [Roseiconus nitratireducens]KAA5547238.1 CDP-diacylglycerol--serine O-phosphatidyltransferase [Roseiconus nitratireducens]
MSELKRRLFSEEEPTWKDGETIEDEGRNVAQSGRERRHHKRKRRRKLMLAVLPTMLTLGNGMCGLGAIAVAVSGAELGWPLEQKLFTSGMLIFGGMLFDALDGSAARMAGQETQFGAELDSLCDAVTFGTAPAVIIWRISDAMPQRFLWAVGVLFTLCVLIRLARFNVETDEEDSHETFEGLPSPAAAGTLAALAIAMPDLKAIASDPVYPANVQWLADRVLVGSHYFIPALAGVLAYLMVSRVQYPHLVSQWIRGRRSPHQIGQALFAVGGVFLLHWLALPIAFCYYAFAAPIRSLLRPASEMAKAKP